MLTAQKTTSVMISWIVLSSAAVNVSWPMRLAGTWRQYSKKAIPQLTRIASHSADCLCLRCPYQANVMNTLERVKRTMVTMGLLGGGVADSGGTIGRGRAAVKGGRGRHGGALSSGGTSGTFSA